MVLTPLLERLPIGPRRPGMATGPHSAAMYLTLAASLRREIVAGGFHPGQMIASEHDLARRENVSRVTVRRASELLIKEGLLERRPGKGLFVADPGTRTVATSASEHPPTHSALAARTVQVVAGNLAWEPCLQAARGVQAAARGEGTQVQLYDAHGHEAADLAMIRQLPDGPAQGAVIVALHSAGFVEALCALKLGGYPFVLVDQRLRDIEVPSVLADNHGGGLAVGRHLLALGHRRIGFIGDLVADTVQARLTGLRDAVGDAGLPFDRSLVVDLRPEDRLGDWSAQVEAQCAALLDRPDRPSAVFASCDAVARPVLAAAAKRGLRVPQDLSVAGFDDDPLATLVTPALTSVRQPFQELGRAAFALLAARLASAGAAVEHRVLPVELVVRASTGPAPSPP
jgi:LacI family transcriptional regulator